MNASLDSFLHAALAEDLGQGDITTVATVPADARCEARLIAKQDGVLSGIDVFRRTFELLLQGELHEWSARFDGERFEKGDLIASFGGKARNILSAERTAMNLVQHLSGIATLTAAFCAAVDGTTTRICDTRKTTPLLRGLEKAAVLHGGGVNHRFNLGSGVLIKENHITAAGGITTAIHRARASASHVHRIEVEVSTLEELQEALAAGVDTVLLDNMDLETIRAAAKIARAAGVTIEVSGNMTLARVPDVAAAGVDIISVGALTHSAPAVDFSLLITNA